MRTDFDALWNYADAAGTESAFRALLPEAIAAGGDDPGYELELLTQIARTLGLQRKFDEANSVLDDVDARIADATPPRVRVRSLLERGRVLNSSGSPRDARPLFLQAAELAQRSGLEALAVDAMHMIAIVEPEPAGQLDWNSRAMKLAESSADPAARKWLASLYNNIGWTYFQQRRFADALDVFTKAVSLREQAGKPKELRIARYSVGKTLRAAGRLDEALQIQLAQHADAKRHGHPDGYICEEIAECLLSLNRRADALPYFRRAHELLSKDDWLVRNEPARVERLRELGREDRD